MRPRKSLLPSCLVDVQRGRILVRGWFAVLALLLAIHLVLTALPARATETVGEDKIAAVEALLKDAIPLADVAPRDEAASPAEAAHFAVERSRHARFGLFAAFADVLDERNLPTLFAMARHALLEEEWKTIAATSDGKAAEALRRRAERAKDAIRHRVAGSLQDQLDRGAALEKSLLDEHPRLLELFLSDWALRSQGNFRKVLVALQSLLLPPDSGPLSSPSGPAAGPTGPRRRPPSRPRAALVDPSPSVTAQQSADALLAAQMPQRPPRVWDIIPGNDATPLAVAALVSPPMPIGCDAPYEETLAEDVVRRYNDAEVIAKQLRALEPPGSRGERLLVDLADLLGKITPKRPGSVPPKPPVSLVPQMAERLLKQGAEGFVKPPVTVERLRIERFKPPLP